MYSWRLAFRLSVLFLVLVFGLIVLRWQLVAVAGALYTGAVASGLSPGVALSVTLARCELLGVVAAWSVVWLLLGWQVGGLLDVVRRCAVLDGSDVPGGCDRPPLSDFAV